MVQETAGGLHYIQWAEVNALMQKCKYNLKHLFSSLSFTYLYINSINEPVDQLLLKNFISYWSEKHGSWFGL